MSTPEPGPGELVAVNGIELYVERHGSGRPLVLLHGGLMSGDMFAPMLPALTERHEVILVDLQGHGRTADIDRPLDVRLMADDIGALIEHLGLDHPDVVGYSLGGGVAWNVAFRFPDRIRKLVTCSANISRNSFYPEMLPLQEGVGAAAAEFMKQTPMYQLYERVAPDPAHFPAFLDKVGSSMRIDFDFSAEVAALTVPTLVMCADADMAPPSHYVEVFGLLDGGKRDGGWMNGGRPKGGHALAILPNTTHYNVTDSPLFPAAVLAFLDAEDA